MLAGTANFMKVYTFQKNGIYGLRKLPPEIAQKTSYGNIFSENSR